MPSVERAKRLGRLKIAQMWRVMRERAERKRAEQVCICCRGFQLGLS